MAKTTRRVTIKRKKPALKHVLGAIEYWDLLNGVSHYFKQARMPTVQSHLDAACAEIDRIWMENDFNGK